MCAVSVNQTHDMYVQLPAGFFLGIILWEAAPIIQLAISQVQSGPDLETCLDILQGARGRIRGISRIGHYIVSLDPSESPQDSFPPPKSSQSPNQI